MKNTNTKKLKNPVILYFGFSILSALLIYIALTFQDVQFFNYEESRGELNNKVKNVEKLIDGRIKFIEALQEEINNTSKKRKFKELKDNTKQILLSLKRITEECQKIETQLFESDKAENKKAFLKNIDQHIEHQRIQLNTLDSLKTEVVRQLHSNIIAKTNKSLIKLQKEKSELILEGDQKDEIISKLEIENEQLQKENNRLLTTVQNLTFELEKLKEEIKFEKGNAADTLDELMAKIKQLNDTIKAQKEKLELNNNAQDQLLNNQQSLCKLALNSFQATYKRKEKGKLIQLDDLRKHNSWEVRRIYFKFLVCDDLIENSKTTMVDVKLLDAKGNPISSTYSMEIPVKNYEGKGEFRIKRKLRKGNYTIKIYHKGKTLFSHVFTISRI